MSAQRTRGGGAPEPDSTAPAGQVHGAFLAYLSVVDDTTNAANYEEGFRFAF